MKTAFIHALVIFTLLGTVTPARADDANFRPYLVGSRAAGMGGATTALADDGSGPYYNPGGLAFAPRSSLSLSASVYGLAMSTEKDALGSGHDFNARDPQIFPVSTAAIFKWGRSKIEDGERPNAFGLTVFVPDAVLQDDRDTLGSHENAAFFGRSEQTVWAGATYAHRFGHLGLGASCHMLIGTAISSVDLTATTATDRFTTISGRADRTAIGLVGSFGARLDVTDRVRVGLGVFSPELGVYDQRRVFVRVTAAAPELPNSPLIQVVNEEGLHASPALPWRVQAGAAWSSQRLTLAADAVLLAPREVTDDVDTDYARRVTRNLVVNAALGVEYIAADAIPLRAGFFTDFSAAPEPIPYAQPAPDPNPENSTHVNRYGGTFSIGYKTDHTHTDIGLMVSNGVGQEVIPNNFNFQEFRLTEVSHTLLYVFLASAYQF